MNIAITTKRYTSAEYAKLCGVDELTLPPKVRVIWRASAKLDDVFFAVADAELEARAAEEALRLVAEHLRALLSK